MKLMWQLAWRFRSSKRQNGFISFISASSTIGIGLGCFVLILLLSVMNGFERELKERLLSVIPHGELFSVEAAGINNWQAEIAKLSNDPRIEFVEPYSKATGLLQKGIKMKAVELTGISPEYAEHSSAITTIAKPQWEAFANNGNGKRCVVFQFRQFDFPKKKNKPNN